MMHANQKGAMNYAAILTALGRGAIAVVRVWGPGAVAVVDAVFRPTRGASLAQTPGGRPRLGRLGEGLGDEVVAVITDDDPPEVEIQCHGGSAAVELVLAALRIESVVIVEPERWVGRQALARVTAEAWIDLARAPTLRSADVLLDQAEGALERELRRIAATIETDPGAALDALESLIERCDAGTRLLTGWRVVLAGRPNVGKSRLLNALAGFERAIVHATPGTTRDVVTVRTAIGGWPVELADTAGLRAADNPIEAAGVRMARDRQRAADLVLLLLDRSEPITEEDRALMADYPAALVVASKADLPAAWAETDLGAMAVSSTSGDGLEALLGEIRRRIVPASTTPGSAMPFRGDHVESLSKTRALLIEGEIPPALAELARWLVEMPDTGDEGRSG